MSNYAKLENNTVVNIIVANEDFISTQPGIWYKINDNLSSQNCAIIGAKYDSLKDNFIHPKPYPSWILNSDNIWEAPVPKPEGDGWYVWSEELNNWKLIN